MKYELINTSISPEYPVFDTNNQLTTDYKVIITISLHPTDNIAPNFSKDIEVISSNSQTGFDVDAQRELAITNYINQINQ